MFAKKPLLLILVLCVCPLAFGEDGTPPAAPSPPLPLSPPSLKGVVTGSSDVAVGYVTLWNGGAGLKVQPDSSGRYEFPKLDPGAYMISCEAFMTRAGGTAVSRAISPVTIEADKTRVEDFSFEGKYRISGRVLYDDLSPAAGRIVTGRFVSHDTNREYVVSAAAGTDGAYALSSPLPMAAFVGMVDDNGQAMVKPQMDVAKGVENIDFVMPTGTAREGLTAELTMTKDSFAANETPTAALTVKNGGKRDYAVGDIQALWSVEVDGVWYAWMEPISARSALLLPGKEVAGIQFSIGKEWKTSEGSGVALSPGRHCLSVATTAEPAGKGMPARIESNRAWFEVQAAK